jgi:hypothetical protein
MFSVEQSREKLFIERRIIKKNLPRLRQVLDDGSAEPKLVPKCQAQHAADFEKEPWSE